jgi:hypothetical protein
MMNMGRREKRLSIMVRVLRNSSKSEIMHRANKYII